MVKSKIISELNKVIYGVFGSRFQLGLASQLSQGTPSLALPMQEAVVWFTCLS